MLRRRKVVGVVIAAVAKGKTSKGWQGLAKASAATCDYRVAAVVVKERKMIS